MNYNQAYLMGYYCALLQGSMKEDCRIEDKERKLKRAWILGYTQGLRELWQINI